MHIKIHLCKEAGIKWMSIEATENLVNEQAKAAERHHVQSQPAVPPAPHKWCRLQPRLQGVRLPHGGTKCHLAQGITMQAGLFDFFHKWPKHFEHVSFIMGNNEGYNSTYNFGDYCCWDGDTQDMAHKKVTMFQWWLHEWWQQGDQLGKFMFLHHMWYDMNSCATILECTLWNYILMSHAMDLICANLNDLKCAGVDA
ncbi:hypothetical protein M422DRAFT_266293 [Sphaerobolus stellatus SS14]|uniref:Calcineurin-like phosphoesterase domain-containing protein n=1 Tax=Sphaerobolus stellatus (strain SS14) TaxID=990650 RepID=A0A0C9TPH6_SPHS4|nr:hypothetical protein M422DRAFT_266293 [Sphaerobolus stellatus SS14]